jgi:DNA-binding transcriptional ArsR family regulator
MKTVLSFGAEDWPRCRFTRSLLWETVQAVRTLVEPVQQQYHRAWLDTIDRDEAQRHLPGLIALNPHAGWVPDFLAPPPRPATRTIEEELTEVASYHTDLVAADIQRSLASNPTRGRRQALGSLIAEPLGARQQLVDELRYAWTVLVAPFWDPVHELIDADVAYRSAQIIRGGFDAALHGLHPNVTLAQDSIIVKHSDGAHLDLAGRGLALMPSAFVWPHAIVVHDRTWPPTLVYPARGIGDLWTRPSRAPSGLAAVLGRTRALLLDDLDRPATTTTLAARHNISPAATSTQLSRLRTAGLITSQRVGKEVRYRRTTLGDALTSANRPSPSAS